MRPRSAARLRQDAGAGGRDPSSDELFSRMIAKAQQRVIIIAASGVVASLALILVMLFLPAVDFALVAPFAAAALAVSACTLASYEVARRVADAYSYKLYARLSSAQLPLVREASRVAEGTHALVRPAVPAVPAAQAPPSTRPSVQQPRPAPLVAQPTTTAAVSQRRETLVRPIRPVQPAPRIQAALAALTPSPTCPQCGRELPYGDLHLLCPFCGFRLK
uniref:Zinc ribbon domain-containing protein n=1 Tax=Thermofilum pendens TaxID=2269 RepID=A0A7J3X8J1_THEPE